MSNTWVTRSLCLGVYRNMLPADAPCGFDTGPSPVKFLEAQRKHQTPWWNPNGSVFPRRLEWTNLSPPLWKNLDEDCVVLRAFQVALRAAVSMNITAISRFLGGGAIGLSTWLGRLFPSFKTWMHGCVGCAWLHLYPMFLAYLWWHHLNLIPLKCMFFFFFSGVMAHLICFSSSHLHILYAYLTLSFHFQKTTCLTCFHIDQIWTQRPAAYRWDAPTVEKGGQARKDGKSCAPNETYPEPRCFSPEICNLYPPRLDCIIV